MAEPMTLKNEDVGRTGEYVKPWLRELVDEMAPRKDLGGAGTLNTRFEDTNARFNTLTRMIGVGVVVVTSLTTLCALLS